MKRSTLIALGAALFATLCTTLCAEEGREYRLSAGNVLPYLFRLQLKTEAIDRSLYGLVVFSVAESRDDEIVLTVAESIQPGFDDDLATLSRLLKEPTMNRFVDRTIVIPRTGCAQAGGEDTLPFMLGPVERWFFPPLDGLSSRSYPVTWQDPDEVRFASNVPVGQRQRAAVHTLLHEWEFTTSENDQQELLVTHTRSLMPMPGNRAARIQLHGHGTSVHDLATGTLEKQEFDGVFRRQTHYATKTAIHLEITRIDRRLIARLMRPQPAKNAVAARRVPRSTKSKGGAPLPERSSINTSLRNQVLLKLHASDEKKVQEGLRDLRKLAPTGIDNRVAGALEELIGTVHAETALWELNRWATADSIPALARCFDDDAAHRKTAAVVLERLGPDVEPFILPVLDSHESDKVRLAIRILSATGGDASLRSLRHLTSSSERRTAAAAKRAATVIRARLQGSL